MFKFLIFFIKKHLYSAKKEWKKFDSFFALFGILISVAIITITISIFEGYQRALKDVILGTNSHIYIFKNGIDNLDDEDVFHIKSTLEKDKRIIYSSPVIQTNGMATNKKRIKGCLIKGIDIENQAIYDNFLRYVNKTDFDISDGESIILGNRLANRLNVNVGDTIKVLSPLNSRISLMGLTPAEKRFRIAALYNSGMYEYDNTMIFMTLGAAKTFVENSQISLVEGQLKEKHIDDAHQVSVDLKALLGRRYQVRNWLDFNSNLFSLLEVEKWVLYFVLNFLVLVAAFNIVSNIYSSILEKRREICILRSFGASNWFIKQMFLGKTMVISGLTVVLGEILGIIVAYLISIQNFVTLKGDVYFLDRINVYFRIDFLIMIFFVSMIIVFLTSLIPLKKVSRINIIETIRQRG